MSHVFIENMAKCSFSEENNPIETFRFHGQDEPFGVGVQIRRTRRQLHRFNLRRSQQTVKMLAELTIPVADNIPIGILHEHAFIDIGDIPYNLCNPALIRIRRNSSHVHLACPEVNEEKNVVNGVFRDAPYFGRKEIGRNKHVRMSIDELPPSRLLLAIAGRGQSVSLQNIRNR